MNSKLIAGISLASIAGAAFWACGEGNINEMTMMDDIVSKQYSTVEELINLKEDAMKSCKEDMGCYTQYQAYLDGTEEPVIDNPDPIEDPNQGQQNPNPNTGLSSSSRGAFDIVDKPKSSANIIDAPIEQSSSSLQIVDGGTFGTCAPAKNPIGKGDKVQWQFTPNMQFTGATMDVMKLAKATYAWTFADDAIDDGTQTSMMSGKITYNNSGATTASVTVTYEGAAYQINCEPLQVNGFPITCTCDVTGGDITDDQGIATWTASCTSQGNITSYTWDGTDLGADGAAYPYTFAKKGDEHTPTLFVANDDNTVQEVKSCPAVKATDSSIPDYILTFEGTQIPSSQDVSQAIPMGTEACIQVSFDWQSDWTPDNISVLCDVMATSPGLNLSISYNGQTKSYKGDYNISNSGIALGKVSKGANKMDNVCVTATGSGTAKCFFGN